MVDIVYSCMTNLCRLAGRLTYRSELCSGSLRQPVSRVDAVCTTSATAAVCIEIRHRKKEGSVFFW